MNTLESLRTCHLFQDMSNTEILTLSKLFGEKIIDEGMMVFVENMPGESLYLIRQGAVKISKMMAEGDEKTLVILGAEDVFGEMAILDGAPRSVTARVAEKAYLLSMRKLEYESLCENEPRLALKLTRNIVRIFSRRIRENNEEYREMLLWALRKQA